MTKKPDISLCYNPTEQSRHNLLGYQCDGVTHKNPPGYPATRTPAGSIDFLPPDVDPRQPWWNDGDKVAGAAATIVMLGVAAVICALLVALAVWIWP